jgi:hypothetical protein
MTNVSGPTPAGWYHDPAGSGHLRWWDGSAWTAHLVPQPEPVPTPIVQAPVVQAPVVQASALPPVQGSTFDSEPVYVPFQGAWNSTSQGSSYGNASLDFARPAQWNTIWVWLLAFSTLLTVVVVTIFFLVAGGATLTPSEVFGYLALSAALYVINILFAAADRKKLIGWGYLSTASIWWTLLSPLFYLIFRAIAVRREVGRGIAPLIAYLVVTFGASIILSIGSAVFIPAFLALHGGATNRTNAAQFTAGLRNGLDEHGGNYTVSCPSIIPSAIGATFSCTATDAATQTTHVLNIQITAGANGEPGLKLLSVVPPVTS